jgi:hypothetical protein
MGRVPAAETTSIEKNRCPSMVFLTWEISRNQIDSCLDFMAREVTLSTCIYSANRSQLSQGACVHCHAIRVANPRSIQVGFVHLSAQFLHPVTIIRCCYTCSTWNSICHDDSLVIISKISHFFHLLTFLAFQALDHRLWWHVLHENELPNGKLYYGPLSSLHKLHAKHCKFLLGFGHVKFQSWLTFYDLQPSRYPRRLQTPYLTLVNSKWRKLWK